MTRKILLGVLIVLAIAFGCSDNITQTKKDVALYFDQQNFTPDFKKIEFQIKNKTVVYINSKQKAFIIGNDKCKINSKTVFDCVAIKPEETIKKVSFLIVETGEKIDENLSIERIKNQLIVRRPNGYPIHTSYMDNSQNE
ncbi:hypothetical protein [Sulfurimonas sp.]